MEVGHRFAGVVVHLASDPEIPHLLGGAFGRFAVAAKEADLRCRIRPLPVGDPPAGELAKRELMALERMVGFPRLWLGKRALRNRAVRGQLERCLGHPELVELELRWGRAIFFDHSRGELVYFYPPDWLGAIAGPMMVASYRNLLAPFWPGFSAFAVHAAGLVRRGRAALFLAADEGGKSTLVSLCRDSDAVLSDDQVLLRRREGRVAAHATPFGRVTDGDAAADLAAIFLLEKSDRTEVEPIGKGEVLAWLLEDHARLFLSLPKARRAEAFGLLDQASSQAATYRLRFPKSNLDLGLLDAAIAAGAATKEREPGRTPAVACG